MATTTSTKRSKKIKQQSASGRSGSASFWSKAAPSRLRKLSEPLDSPDAWRTWQKHLAKRKLPPLAKLLGRRQPEPNGFPSDSAALSAAAQLSRLLAHASAGDEPSIELESAAYSWLSQAEVAAADVPLAAEALIWADALPLLSRQLSARAWTELTQRLIAMATSDHPTPSTLTALLLYAELPSTLAYSLPELAATEALLDAVRCTLDEWSDQALDATGTIDGRHLDRLMPTIASLSRIRTIGRACSRKLWSSDVQKQFELLVEYAWRLTRADGSAMFRDDDRKAYRKQLRAALSACKRDRTLAVAAAVEKGSKTSDNAPAPSWQLEDAGLAALRCDWRKRSPQLSVNHSTSDLISELAVGKEVIWSGTHALEVRIDGEQLSPEGPWQQVCWESDRDIDYLELELPLTGGVVVQRHLALARQDQCLFIADAILGTKDGKFEYLASYPLAEAVRFLPETETREGVLMTGGDLPLRIAPLALNEWRNGPSTRGELEFRDRQLVLTQSGEGRNLLVPIFLDLQPRRAKRDITWRQLTVGRERKPVPRDEAVGYRVQVGNEQWLLYRAMGGAATRTVLGKNLFNELLIGRFHSEDGQVTTLVEIEA